MSYFLTMLIKINKIFRISVRYKKGLINYRMSREAKPIARSSVVLIVIDFASHRCQKLCTYHHFIFIILFLKINIYQIKKK